MQIGKRQMLINLFVKKISLTVMLFALIFSLTTVYTYTRAGGPTRAYAATSSNLNFQARLLNNAGNTVTDGYYNVEFNLYTVSTGGTAEWTETRTGANKVRVANGYLSVALGEVTTFPNTVNWDQDHWLTMNIGGTGSPAWDGEMTPRLKLTAVPYAFQAKQAERLTKLDGANTGILDFLALTANRTINLPNQDGTLCIQGSADCVDVATTADTATTSSNSGLEISSDGLRLLGGCTNAQILSWDETDKLWECTTSGAAANSFGTVNAPSGTDPVADGPGAILNLAVLGANATITGDSTTDSLSFDIVESALAGNGLVANGDALDVNTGNGLEVVSDAVRINQDYSFTWTADQTWNLSEAEDLAVNSSISGTNSGQGQIITITNSSTSGNQYGLYVDNTASSGTTDSLLVLDNSDTDTAVTSAIRVVNAGGGFTDLFDIAGTLISTSEFTVLDGGLSESEVTGEIEAVTAGSGLTGGGTADSVTLDIGAGNGISVAADAISVIYGSTANTAVQGSTTLVCASGAGDLSGGGNTITLGAGGTCSNITISEAPVFDTSVTTPLITNAGALTLQTTATGGADDLIFKTAGNEVMRLLENGNLFFERGTDDATIVVASPSGAPATYTFSGATGTVLTTANLSGTGDALYVNVGESPAAGDVSGSFSGGLLVNSVQSNSVDLTTDTVGNYVASITAGGGLTGTAASEGSTPTLAIGAGNGITVNADDIAVIYGSSANTAAQGNVGLTCPSGTGDLSGGGTAITLGTGGTCGNITISESPVFDTSVTTPLVTYAGLMTIQTTATGGTDDIVLTTAGTERLRLLESGGLSLVGNASIDGTIFDATGDLVLDDQLALGSASTGLQITTDGVISDLDDTTISFAEGVTISAGGLSITSGDLNVVAGNIQTNSVTRLENDGDLVNIGNLTAAAALVIANTGAGSDITINSIDQIIINAGTTIELQDSTNITGSLDVSAALNVGTGNALQVNSDGDLTANMQALNGSSTTNGTSGVGTSTTLILNSAANFDVGNYVQISDANCGGTGINPCYAKITAKGGAGNNTLTVTPALRWTNAKTVTEYHVPELGGTNLTSTLANRYGRGYFISGVATGNGTTFYNEDSIETSLDTFNLVNENVTTLNIGGAATTLNVGSAATTVSILGSLQTAASETITAGGGLVVASGGATITGGIDNNSGGLTETGTLAGVTGIAFTSGGLDLATGGITNAGVVAGVSTLNASGLITSAGLTAGTGLIQGTGGLTIVGAISLDGAIVDPTGNIVLDDTVDIGSAANGIRVATDGSILDINGDIILNDQVAIGSATTGLLVTTDGVVTDLDDSSISFAENVTVSSGGISVTGDSSIAGILSALTGFSQASGNFGIAGSGTFATGTGAISLNGATSVTGTNTFTVGTGLASFGGTIAANGSSITTDDTTFNLVNATATTVNFAGGATALNIGAAGGGLTIQGANALTIKSATTNAITLDSGTTGAVDIGTGANAKTVTVGSITGAASTIIRAGTGGLTIGNGGIANTIQIGNTSGAVTQTINLGTNATASSVTNVTIGSAIGASATTISAGSAGLSLSAAATTATGTFTSTGLVTANGNFTLQTGDTLTINGEGITDLTGNGLILSGTTVAVDATTTGTTTTTTGNSGLEVTATGLSLYKGCANNQILKWATAGGGAWACAADGVSDSRLKENITDVGETMLDRIKDVRVVTFDYKCDHPAFQVMHCDSEHQTGVIAQEIAQIFPELVKEVNGYYQVNYEGLALYNLKAVSELARSIHSNGDATLNNVTAQSLTVDGVLTAGTIRADHIEGLDYLGRIDSIEARVDTTEDRLSAVENNQNLNIDLSNLNVGKLTAGGDASLQNLAVNLDLVAKGSMVLEGTATFKEAVRFEKNVLLEGEINVLGYANVQGLTVNLDLIVKGAMVIDGKATFKEAARFEKDVVFEKDVAVKGQTTFNKDTAGYVTVKEGETVIKVTFTNPKARKPVIALTLGEGKFAQYSYRNVSEEGFEIILLTPATEDLSFSWVAIQTEEVAEVPTP